METKDKDFFREATVRICGSLEIETALWRSFLYISDFIPATEVYLCYYEDGLGAARLYAMADREHGARLDVHVPLPPELRTMVEKKEIPEILLVNDSTEHPLTDIVSRVTVGGVDLRVLIPLRLEGISIGLVSFHAEGKNRFSPSQLSLLSSLKEPFAVALSNSRRYQELLELKELLDDDNKFLRGELRRGFIEGIVGAHLGLRGVMELAGDVAPLGSPVLLLGETGVGKEVIANAIHQLSPRKDGPFIKVNCGAIPDNLMDSELFGHERGAFTGAVSRTRGRFERAHGGTIFLDEVGELSPDAQVRLLRVLQDKEFERVGGTETLRVDLRVIAATHRNLEAMVTGGMFREDLYYRLRVFPIWIPPLRERKMDIPALVSHFLRKKAHDFGLSRVPVLAKGEIDRLIAQDWPGNVRELENTVERALILCRDKPVSFQNLNLPAGKQTSSNIEEPAGDVMTLGAVMAKHIERVLNLTGGKVEGERGAAHLLEINPATLRHKMRKLGIPFGRKA